MNRTKVAHIITRFIKGGAQENTLITMQKLHARDDYDILFITGPQTGPEGSLLDDALNSGIRTVICQDLARELSPMKDLRALHALYTLLKQEKCAIVHTHSSKAGILGRFAAFLARCPIVVHTIHGLPFHPYQSRYLNWLYIAAERVAALVTDTIITVADVMADKSLRAGIGNPKKYTTIYSGMELEPFLTAKKDPGIRKKLGLPKDCILVTKIARLFHLKGYEYFLDAAEQLCEEFSYVYFLIVGGGLLEQDIRDRIIKAGLENRIILTGLVEAPEIPPLIAASDILCHCSLREGLARVIPQAFASARPVVTFDIDGASEIVKNGMNGFLVPPEDVADLTNRLRTLITDNGLRNRMGRRGRERVIPDFDANYMVQKIVETYNTLQCT